MPPPVHEPIIGLPAFKIISYQGTKTVEIIIGGRLQFIPQSLERYRISALYQLLLVKKKIVPEAFLRLTRPKKVS